MTCPAAVFRPLPAPAHRARSTLGDLGPADGGLGGGEGLRGRGAADLPGDPADRRRRSTLGWADVWEGMESRRVEKQGGEQI